MKHMRAALFFVVIVLPAVSPCHGLESLQPVDTTPFERTPPESTSLFEFFKQRTHLGLGFEEIYTDNLLFQTDNQKQEDYTSTFDSDIFFADPRGSLLYGVDWEMNARRYHIHNETGIDHDVRAFIDLDPGGRTQYRFDYLLGVSNSFVLGPENVDILRQSSHLSAYVDQKWIGRIRYALNNTNALVPQVTYNTFDDTSSNDTDIDRRGLETVLDLDHDLIPGWILFGGYGYDRVWIIGNSRKNSQGHTARMGIKYELSRIANLEILGLYAFREWESHQERQTPGASLRFDYQLGPRTRVTCTYLDRYLPSFGSNRLEFRNRVFFTETSYELTPLIRVTLGGRIDRQTSGLRDVLAGNPPTTQYFRQYVLTSKLRWQLREKTNIEINYNFSRSTTRDYTNHFVRLSFETEF